MTAQESNGNQDTRKSIIDRYYDINSSHLQFSFWASLAALLIGLIVLAFGLMKFISGDTSIVSSLSTIAGVLTQFIAAGFFFLYSKNLKQSNVFFERLVKHQDTLYAFSLVAKLPEAKQSETYERIINVLLMRNEPQTQLSPELVKALSDSKDKNA